METHETRLTRREQAQALEQMDADVRLDILGFRDREDFKLRREQWFGGAGSIDRRDNIKELVSKIMEGSAEAFRLRRERYGY